MGGDVSDNSKREPGTVQLNVPKSFVGLLNRVMQLQSGVHLVHVVKTRAGKFGLVGWQVTEGSGLEQPKKSKKDEPG